MRKEDKTEGQFCPVLSVLATCEGGEGVPPPPLAIHSLLPFISWLGLVQPQCDVPLSSAAVATVVSLSAFCSHSAFVMVLQQVPDLDSWPNDKPLNMKKNKVLVSLWKKNQSNIIFWKGLPRYERNKKYQESTKGLKSIFHICINKANENVGKMF